LNFAIGCFHLITPFFRMMASSTSFCFVYLVRSKDIVEAVMLVSARGHIPGHVTI
jgi:hypothetical protein